LFVVQSPFNILADLVLKSSRNNYQLIVVLPILIPIHQSSRYKEMPLFICRQSRQYHPNNLNITFLSYFNQCQDNQAGMPRPFNKCQDYRSIKILNLSAKATSLDNGKLDIPHTKPNGYIFQ